MSNRIQMAGSYCFGLHSTDLVQFICSFAFVCSGSILYNKKFLPLLHQKNQI